MEEGIHWLSRSDPDIFEGPRRPNLRLWVLELGAEKRFDARLKNKDRPWSSYKGDEIPRAVSVTVWDSPSIEEACRRERLGYPRPY